MFHPILYLDEWVDIQMKSLCQQHDTVLLDNGDDVYWCLKKWGVTKEYHCCGRVDIVAAKSS